jgi:GNAT superfamily N-acetyltransferase
MDATDRQFSSVTDLNNVINAEANADDPPSTVEDTRVRLQNIPALYAFQAWASWDGARVVAMANAFVPRMETNQHVVQFDISVLPEYRRQGLATAFLSEIAKVAERESRRLLISNSNSTVPAGGKFMEALGATVGLSQRRSDLLKADVDRDLVRSWIDRASERAGGFELVEFVGPYPEVALPAISKMQLAINTMPIDDMDIEAIELSPENLRQIDDAMVAQGNDRWALIAREKSTGKYVGWTDMHFNPRTPRLADVGGTAVTQEYKNLGLGRWLKAAILEKLLTEKPEIERVRTGNAHSNAPMLKINDELGFKPALTLNLWQVDLDTVKEYLARHQQPETM